MKHTILFISTIVLFGCSQSPKTPSVQEQIKTDYARIQMEIMEVEAELLYDTLEMASARYEELLKMDDSLQTAIFKMYSYEDLKTFFEENVKGTMNEFQYQNLLAELEEYK